MFQDAAIYELLRTALSICQDKLPEPVKANVQEANAAGELKCHLALLLTLAYLQKLPDKWVSSIFKLSPKDCDDLMCTGINWLQEALSSTEYLLKVRKGDN